MTATASASIDRRPGRRRFALAAAVVAVGVSAAGWVAADWWFCLPADAQAEYVGAERCRECHKAETNAWHGSDHHRAMDHAREDTVLGDFADAAVKHFDLEARFFRRDGRYFVRTDGPDGQMTDFPVVFVFGWYPLQQYLVEFPGGRMQCLPWAWDVPRKRWFHLYPGEPIRHEDPLHWTKPMQNWNYMCADCHSTNLKRGFDLETNSYHTTYSEINVSCETCHGPGSLHAQVAEKKWFFWDRRRGMALPNLKSADHRVEIETCAPCHARRRVLADGFRPGDKFLDFYLPEMLDGSVYYADGQILDEVYEYGSFTQSKMYHNQVRCSNCHDPHSLHVKFTVADPQTGRPKVVDNRVCGQCHLPAKYDTPAHDHHPRRDQPGALCVDCHMPVTHYMVVDPRRDHSLRVPDPQLTIDLGIPNACNRCHHDQTKGETPEWARDLLVQWYGSSKRPQHFAYAIELGRRGDPRAERLLDAVTRRTDLSAMARASAVALLGQYPNGWAAAVRGLEDAEPLVRAVSARMMETADPGEALRRLTPLVRDPIRAVRIEAARVLAGAGPDVMRDEDYKALVRALAEYTASQEVAAEQPGSHLGLALLYERQGKRAEAEAAYRTALRLDADFIPARNNLAVLLSATGRSSEAEKLLRETLDLARRQRARAAEAAAELPAVKQRRAETTDAGRAGELDVRIAALEMRNREARELEHLIGQLHFSLGMLAAENPQRLAEAEKELAAAAALVPLRPRVRYNWGLALNQLGRTAEAEEQLKHALAMLPEEPDFLYALATFYAEHSRWRDALPYAEQLLRRRPDWPHANQLIQGIRRALRE